MNKEQLDKVLAKHKLWLDGKPDGERANLTYADLTGANLRYANLLHANMTGAVLTGANLSGANLLHANMTGAVLTGADLRGVTGSQFITFQFGRHYAVFAGGYGYIGCERRTYQEWLNNYAEIGKDNGYTDEECSRYGKWIQDAVDYLLQVESVNHAACEQEKDKQ